MNIGQSLCQQVIQDLHSNLTVQIAFSNVIVQLEEPKLRRVYAMM